MPRPLALAIDYLSFGTIAYLAGAWMVGPYVGGPFKWWHPAWGLFVLALLGLLLTTPSLQRRR